ncbi:amino acid/polyamine transporter I [Lineolata rhizophorae]|uniref:Amino acid/polyamine transporter I n=1 Tax=Lineolata rhizophorae TaxID=578093 RepID=A0A6A6PDJ6_9PEZI|nr:amino acid/polyamine transporter I [Lineolata rhizophorae]
MEEDNKTFEMTVHGEDRSPASDAENGSMGPAGGAGALGDVRQRLDRFITLKPAVAFGLTVLSSWEGLALTFGAALLNGGPSTMVYGTIVATIGSLSLSCSLAEMASITPVVGAQYRWTSLYAPRVMSPEFWGLVQGWLTIFAWISLCAAVSFVAGTVVQGLIILNKEDYVPEAWHGTLLQWSYLLVPYLCNLFARKILPALEILGGIMHVVFFIAAVVTLTVLAPRSSAEFVFNSSLFGQSGWTNEGVQWCIGLLSITAVLTGFDGVLHLSDEIKNPPRKVPRSMILSVVINGVLALAFMITLLFCIGDVEAAVNTPTGYPIIQVYYSATKSKAGATILTIMLLIPMLISLFGVIASVSRLAWSFARDGGLPFHEFFGYTHPTLRIPLNALGLVVVVAGVLGLINLGSTEAFFAIVSLATLGLYVSYVLPILFMLMRKIKNQHPEYGPFQLGKWGIPVNIFALCYAIFIIIWLPFPATQPTTANSMNYAGPILIFVILMSLVDWFISGHKRFHVPTHYKAQ